MVSNGTILLYEEIDWVAIKVAYINKKWDAV